MRTIAFFIAAVLAGVGTARAQSRDALVSVGGGVGVTHPYHGDLNFIAPSWELDAVVGRDRVVVDVSYGRWWRDEQHVIPDVVISGPTGVIGRVAELDERTHRTTTRVEVGVLRRFRVGRAHVAGGGGVGVMTMARRYQVQGTGCSGTVPDWCVPMSQTYTEGTFAFHAAGLVDVRLRGRWSVYGAARLGLPSQDIGSMELRTLGGLRFAW